MINENSWTLNENFLRKFLRTILKRFVTDETKNSNYSIPFWNTRDQKHSIYYTFLNDIFICLLDIRLAALEALVDFTRVDGKWEDLEFLLDMTENDPHPGIRHKLIRLLIENPPFDKYQKHSLDQPALVDRLWNLLK